MAAPAPSAPAGRTSAPGLLIQTVYLLLGMLALSGIAGVLLAALFLPAVSLTSRVAEDGVAVFDAIPAELEVQPLNEASRIEAADGSLLATFYSENRVMKPLEEISPHLQNAVIAIEDRRFYEHGGIDFRGTARAFLNNAASGSTQGGSTLTQQYVKNALLMDAVQRGDEEAIDAATETTYVRKLREMKIALSLEKEWSKDEILNAYLNVAQFGPSQYGVETGSQHYFSKPAADLNPGEAALLAGITNSPNGNDPVAHPERAQNRRDEVLDDMLELGYITQAEHDQYVAQPVGEMLVVQDFQAGCITAGTSGFFCDYVTRSLLADTAFGETPEERRRLLYGGGLTIRTTLDPGKQAAAAEILQRKVPAASENGFGHSIVTVEPGTGRIVAMAENRSFNPYQSAGPGETAINYNVPKELGGGSGFPVGSAFKPFVLTEWVASGRSIYDTVGTARGVTKTFPAHCLSGGAYYNSEEWDPDNAVSVTLAPQETVLNSTKFSVNTSYTNMAAQLGLCDIADRARSLGAIPATYDPHDPSSWTMPIEDMYGQELAPSVVVLGELRISALDMAAAYATYGASGVYCRPTAIDGITDRDGNPMSVTTTQCEQRLDPKVADTVAWVLEQDLADPQATGKGRVIPGHDAGGKTGTSNEQFHTWYVGFTRQMSTAVWFGHPARNVRPGGFSIDDGNLYLRRGSVWGNTVSLPTWQEYMTRVHEGLPNQPFPGQPPGQLAITETTGSDAAQDAAETELQNTDGDG